MMECFETTVVLSEKTVGQELKWHERRRPKDRIIVIAGLFSALVTAFFGATDRDFVLTTLGIGLILLILLLLLRDEVNFRRGWERIRETSTTEGIESVVSFLDKKIKLYDSESGGTIYLDYFLIVRFLETTNWYVLFTRAHQFIAVNKISLIEEGKNEDFIRFLKKKCHYVKWKK